MKRLYFIEITYSAYVLADDEDDAETAVRDIAQTEDFPDVSVSEVGKGDELLADWDRDCNIYETGPRDEWENLTLGEALDRLEGVPE